MIFAILITYLLAFISVIREAESQPPQGAQLAPQGAQPAPQGAQSAPQGAQPAPQVVQPAPQPPQVVQLAHQPAQSPTPSIVPQQVAAALPVASQTLPQLSATPPVLSQTPLSSPSKEQQEFMKSITDSLDQSKVQTLRRQARARLGAVVHAISVLLWEGYVQLKASNGNSCRNTANGGSASSSCSKPELDDVALQLSQNEFGQQLGQTVDGNGPNGVGSSGQCISAAQVPTTGQIIAMITMYSYIYGLINGGESGGGITISDSSTEAEITSAIGTIMRRTSQLQQQLQNTPKK